MVVEYKDRVAHFDEGAFLIHGNNIRLWLLGGDMEANDGDKWVAVFDSNVLFAANRDTVYRVQIKPHGSLS